MKGEGDRYGFNPAESEAKFFTRVANAEVIFKGKNEDAVAGLTLHQGERQISAEKKR